MDTRRTSSPTLTFLCGLCMGVQVSAYDGDRDHGHIRVWNTGVRPLHTIWCCWEGHQKMTTESKLSSTYFIHPQTIFTVTTTSLCAWQHISTYTYQIPVTRCFLKVTVHVNNKIIDKIILSTKYCHTTFTDSDSHSDMDTKICTTKT